MGSIEEFIKMPAGAQAEYAWRQGVLLWSCREGNHHVHLFSLGRFFVELCYNPILNYFFNLAAFTGGPRLEHYLEKIEIAAIP